MFEVVTAVEFYSSVIEFHKYITLKSFGFINGVANVNWPPYRDSKS